MPQQKKTWTTVWSEESSRRVFVGPANYSNNQCLLELLVQSGAWTKNLTKNVLTVSHSLFEEMWWFHFGDPLNHPPYFLVQPEGSEFWSAWIWMGTQLRYRWMARGDLWFSQLKGWQLSGELAQLRPDVPSKKHRKTWGQPFWSFFFVG